MERLTLAEFETLVDGASVLADSHRGPHVYLTPDGKVVKMFRQKRLLTSNRLYPYARRFEENTRGLRARGFASVHVERVAHCREIDKHLVVYPLLEGETIRELADRPALQESALERLPGYLCELHGAGVYYKAFHLGNVLVRPDGSFALIDVHWTRFRRGPVPVAERARNFLNTLSYEEDYASLERFGFERFFNAYLDCAGLDEKQRARLLGKLRDSRLYPDLVQALADL